MRAKIHKSQDVVMLSYPFNCTEESGVCVLKEGAISEFARVPVVNKIMLFMTPGELNIL